MIGILAFALGTLWKNQNLKLGILASAVVVMIVCATISFHRGTFYRTERDFIEQWALESNPDSEIAMVNLAEHYIRSNEMPKALKALEKALIINPLSPAGNNGRGWLLNAEGKFHEARKHLEIAVKAKHNYAEAHNNLGITLSGLREFDLAKKHFETSIAINPNYAEAHGNLGVMHREIGEYDRAIEYHQTALSFDSRYLNSHLELGRIALFQNRLNDATKHFRDVLQIQPDHPEANGRLASLEE